MPPFEQDLRIGLVLLSESLRRQVWRVKFELHPIRAGHTRDISAKYCLDWEAGVSRAGLSGGCALGTLQPLYRETIPVLDYVQSNFVPLSHLAHDWEFHAGLTLTPAEERTMIREPAQAVPDAIAGRLGKLRVLAVPYIACLETGDVISRSKPKGEAHTAAWVEMDDRINVLLACRELDAHDTGFEFLGSVAELLRPRLTDFELAEFSRLLEEEVRIGVRGEIDEEALNAKQVYLASRNARRHRGQFERYRDSSFVSTAAEYVHGMWHDVQIRVGPEHLPVPQLRRRMDLMAQLFPPNPGYQVFDESLAKSE